MVLCHGGALYSFGCGAAGRLGLGNTEDAHRPALLDPIGNGDGESIRVVGIAAGGAHSMAWGEGGEIATWGSGTATGHGDQILWRPHPTLRLKAACVRHAFTVLDLHD